MTKKELIEFLKPFDDDIKIVCEHGADTRAVYALEPDGTGRIWIFENR